MLQSLLLVLSICIDTFVASISYGVDRIKIPLKSVILINFVCSLFLGFSFFIGYFFKDFLSKEFASFLSFILLFILGLYRVFEAFFKNYLNKFTKIKKPINFKVFDFHFVLEVYANETKADYDNSKVLTEKEAIYLASALSFDSLAVGFGISLTDINHFQIIILSFFVGMISILSGVFLGKLFSKLSNINFSCLSGFLLIALSIIKFIN